MRPYLIVSFAIGTLLTGGCEPAALSPDWTRLNPPIEAPAFTLPRVDGASVSLAEQRGRIVIMEFWATWCGPCQESSPSLDAIYRHYRNRGVTVLLINEGETAEVVRRWAERRFEAPILLDQQQEVGVRYGLSGIPHLFIIDREGRMIYTHSGYGGGLEQDLTIILKELLEGQAASSHG